MLTTEQFSLFEQALTQPLGQSFRAAEQEVLIHKGILLSLYQERNARAISILIHAAHSSPHPSICSSSVALLVELAQKHHADALEGLFDLAIDHDVQEALTQVRSASFQSSRNATQAIFNLFSGRYPEYRQLDPHNAILTDFFFNRMNIHLQERLLSAAIKANLREWLILVNALRSTHPSAISDLIAAFGHFSIEHQKLTLHWLNQFAHLESPAWEDAICQIFIQNESSLALDLARQESFFPSSPIQAALFHFLSGDWNSYTQLDFNHALLIQAYETASHPVRKRILEMSRLSGRQEWMTGLSSAARIVWLDDLNDPDWEITLSTLRAAQRFDELWRLAQLAPPLWSARLITELAAAQWKPQFSSEESHWQRLVTSSASCLQNKPKIQPTSVWRSPSPDTTCLAFCPQAALIAAGGSDSSIYLWDATPSHGLLTRLGSPVAQARAAAFSPDGEYLVVASGDHALRTYRLKDAKLIKTMEGHSALVRNLVFTPDGRAVISASFDGTLRAWRFPQGQLLNTIDLGKTEIFSLALSPDGLILLHAGSDPTVTARTWPGADLLFRLVGHEDTVTNLTAAPGGQVAASASRDRQIIVWNYLAGRRLSQFNSGEDLTTQLSFHPVRPVLLVGSLQGFFTIRSITTGASLAQVRGHTSAVTGLATDPSGSCIFTSSQDGVLCQWDLRVFMAVYQSQSSSHLDQTALSALQKAVQPGSADHNWLSFMLDLLRWRQQFDIQIDESPHILPVGEFDIQL